MEQKKQKRNLGQKGTASFEEIRSSFRNPDMCYAPYQFWFWDEELSGLGQKPTDMAREMYEQGFNPGYAHARTNYAAEYGGGGKNVHPLPKEEWLSDAWFRNIESVLRQAKSDGSRFCVADDYGWPSLQAGGRILEHFPSMTGKNLHYTTQDVKGGETYALPPADFAVQAKLLGTQNTSYVEYSGESWKQLHFSFDQSKPSQTETLPYNFAAKYTSDPALAATFHLYPSHSGTFELSARWCDCGGNSADVAYLIQSGDALTEFRANQQRDFLQWNPLGIIVCHQDTELTVTVRNHGTGAMCIDAVCLKNILNPDDYIIVDDLHTLNRKIGIIDSDSLTLINKEEIQKACCCKAPEEEGWYRVYAFTERVHEGYDGSQVDNLDRRLGERFTEIAYRPYFERFSSFQGTDGPMNGIFADTEGSYGYKLAWSPDLEERFRENSGLELKKMLPLMIDRDAGGLEAKVRFEWYDAVSDLFTENFSVPSRYAEEQGMYYTMHTWEESLPFQANTVGDYFKLNRAVTLPGTDCLINVAYNPANFLDTMSVAEFEGRRYMAEMMALAGLEEFHMEELKKQMNYLAAWGVSHVITHSVKMTRTKAQELVTPDFYRTDPGWAYMRQWTDYVRRISYINAHGDLLADVLLLNPMDSIWALSDGANMDPDYDMLAVGGGIPANTASHGGKASEINRIYHETIRQLAHARIEAMTADKHYLREMEVRDGKLVRGKHSFGTVILPPMTVIDLQAAQILLRFAETGGIILYLGELPEGSVQKGKTDCRVQEIFRTLKTLPNVIETRDLPAAIRGGNCGLNPKVVFTEGAFDMLTLCREIDKKSFIWITNNENTIQNFKIRIRCAPGEVSRWNPSDGSVFKIPAKAIENRENGEENGIELNIQMYPYEGFFLVINPEKSLRNPEQEPDKPEKLEKSKKPDGNRNLSEAASKALATGWTAKINTGNQRIHLEHSFPTCCSDRIRIVFRKGPFQKPGTVCLSRLRIFHGKDSILENARIKASSGENPICVLNPLPEKEPAKDFKDFWHNQIPIDQDKNQWMEICLPRAHTFDRISLWSVEGMPLRSYRLECRADGWWKTLVSFHECYEPELICPISYPEEMLDHPVPVELTDWRRWNLLDPRFSGSIDYEWTGELPAAERETFLQLGQVGQIARVWVNGTEAGIRIAQPFAYDVTRLLLPGRNHILVRVANGIASNAGLQEERCGLLGPVTLSYF